MRDRMKLLLLCTVLAGAVWGESKVMTWKIDGVEREAIVYSPTAKTACPGRRRWCCRFTDTAIRPTIFKAWGWSSIGQSRRSWCTRKDSQHARRLGGMASGKRQGRGSRSQVCRSDADDASREVFLGRCADLLHRFFEWRQLHLPAVGGTSASVRGLRSGAARILPSVHLTVPKPLLHVGGTDDRQIAFSDQKEAIEAARRANGAMGKGEPGGNIARATNRKMAPPS